MNTLPEDATDFINGLWNTNSAEINLNNPFDLTSGWKAPMYIDMRQMLSYPYMRMLAKRHMIGLIESQIKKSGFSHDEITIAGIATGSIGIGMLMADHFKTSFVSVHDDSKVQWIEGALIPGQRNIIVVEDVVATGNSTLRSAAVLRATGANILGMSALFSYDFMSTKWAFINDNIPLSSVSNYNTVTEIALELQVVSLADKQKLNEWHQKHTMGFPLASLQ